MLLGAENLPDLAGAAAGRPILFVGNHQRIGLVRLHLSVLQAHAGRSLLGPQSTCWPAKLPYAHALF